MRNDGDFRCIDGGSVIGIAPISVEGSDWWAEHVQEPESWQQMNGFVWCDLRNAVAIIEAFVADGLTVRNGFGRFAPYPSRFPH